MDPGDVLALERMRAFYLLSPGFSSLASKCFRSQALI